jgi:predicted acyltransferase
MWLIDWKGYRAWSKPFVVFGTNALALYVGAELLSRLLGVISFSDGKGGQTALKTWIYENVFLPLGSPLNASLAYAICFIFGWFLVLWLLYRKQIFIKI